MKNAATLLTGQSEANKQRSVHLRPQLLGVGCALPGLSRRQADVAEELADLWLLSGTRLDRWRKIIAGTCIECRYGVAPVEEVVHLSTSQRMRQYETHAPPLAADAARRALAAARVDARSITDLIVVSCTGFSAPGLDAALIGDLGLSPTTRRCMIGFMGCFGAISGVRAAVGACSADPHAVALVVCCELCSLHVPQKPSMQDQVAAALFGDGAAAAVVAGPEWTYARGDFDEAPAALGRLNLGHTRILPEAADCMTWRITDTGFAMTLDRAVPATLRSALPRFVEEASPRAPQTFIVHPGGPGILDAVDETLDLHNARGIDASWRTLARIGNVSSATVLFVLEEVMRSRQLDHPAMLLAFGPGLTIESVSVCCE